MQSTVVAILIAVAVLVFVGLIVLFATFIGRSGGRRLMMAGLVVAPLLELAVGVVVFALRMQQTRLLVTVTAGTAYVGRVVVDGREQRISGNQPQSFLFYGKHIVFTIILVDPSRTIHVDSAGYSVTTSHGAHGEILRDSPWSGGAVLGGLDENDWKRAAADLLPGHEVHSLPRQADAHA